MARLKKAVKWIVAGALVLVAARSSSGTVHNQADPLFCLPTLGGGSVCFDPPGAPKWGDDALIGGFGG